MKITSGQLRRLIRESLSDMEIESGYSEPGVETVTVGEYILEDNEWLAKIQDAAEEERRDIAHDFIAYLSDDLYELGNEVLAPEDGSKLEPWHRGRWDSEEAVTARRDMEFSKTLSNYIKNLMNKRETEVDYIQQVIDAAVGSHSDGRGDDDGDGVMNFADSDLDDDGVVDATQGTPLTEMPASWQQILRNVL